MTFYKVMLVRRGHFVLSLHRYRGGPRCSVGEDKHRTTALKTEAVKSITVSSSIRPLLTKLGDVPDLRLERANRPLLRIGLLVFIHLRRLGDVPELGS